MLLSASLLFLLSVQFEFIQAEQHVLEANVVNKFIARFFVDPNTVLHLAETYNLDIWHATDRTVDIYSDSLPAVLQDLPHSIIPIPPPDPPKGSFLLAYPLNLSSIYTEFHDSYHPLEEVYSFFDQLAAQFPDIMRMVELGRTAEGRKIIGISVSTGTYPNIRSGAESTDSPRRNSNEEALKKRRKHKGSRRPPLRDTEKLSFVVMGAQHAREWVATSTAIYLAHSLVVDETEPNSLHNLLNHFDFYFVPVPNPDGYAYTWQTDRYWYKNRQAVGPYTRCIGLDMNRNWGYKWRSKVSDFPFPSLNVSSDSHGVVLPPDPCSHWYPGSRPFQSPEVNSIANWITTLPNLAAFVDLRSYGQMVSSPYSYSCNSIPRDIEDQTEAALGSSHALSSPYGTQYKVGKLCETLYPAPGNVLDWMYVKEAVKYAYVVHLRDTGTYGFSLPEKWIRPTSEETKGMVDYLSRFIARQTNRRF